ncbi:MAG: hypothetical protein ABSE47_10630 [Acidimicrobiales bacterium]
MTDSASHVPEGPATRRGVACDRLAGDAGVNGRPAGAAEAGHPDGRRRERPAGGGSRSRSPGRTAA